MNKTFLMRVSLLVAMAFTTPAMQASDNTDDMSIKQIPRPVYHAVHNKSLLLAVQQIALRSGIEFKINPDLRSDAVTKKLAADNWKEALSQLLAGYNYTTVSNKGKIKTVLITGKIGSGNANKAPEATNFLGLTVKPENKTLPLRYRNFAAGSVMPVKLPLSKMVAIKLGNKIVLDLPIGQYTVKHDDLVDDGGGASTWMGYLEDEGKSYRIYLSQGEAGIMGSVATPDGRYEIETVDGNTYLIDQARSGLSLAGFAEDQAISSMPTAADIASVVTLSQPMASVTARTTATTGPIVDVMVLYTAVKQTPVYAQQRIKYLVNITNRAYKDSFINMRLRLVHTRKTTYVEKSPNNSALTDLANGNGLLAGVSALRNQYGADLVLLFRPFYASTAGGCGIAFVGFAGGSGANPGNGFGVISDGNSKDAPTNYFCGIQSFAHEVGHTLGNVHDREFSSVSGKFPYSYAWGIDNQFGTIMSYYGPSLMLFATPKLPTQCVGQPCGYAAGTINSSDQSRTINYTGPLVAKYKPTKIVTPVIQ